MSSFCWLFPPFSTVWIPYSNYSSIPKSNLFTGFQGKKQVYQCSIWKYQEEYEKIHPLPLYALSLVPTNRHLQDVGLNIHPIQNWRSRSNTEEVLGNAYPPFHSQSKDVPYTNIQRKGIFCRSGFSELHFTETDFGSVPLCDPTRIPGPVRTEVLPS